MRLVKEIKKVESPHIDARHVQVWALVGAKCHTVHGSYV